MRDIKEKCSDWFKLTESQESHFYNCDEQNNHPRPLNPLDLDVDGLQQQKNTQDTISFQPRHRLTTDTRQYKIGLF